MKTLVVGDIHGCIDELRSLIEAAGVVPGLDRIVAIGDIIDRGPDGLGVVRFLRDTPNCLALLGNHEAGFLNRRWTLEDSSGRCTYARYSEAERAEIDDYLSSLPLFMRLPEALVLHGGLEPGIPLESQDRKILLGVGSEGRPSFSAPDSWHRRLSYPVPVIVGHVELESVVEERGVWFIDTGCAKGGALSGLVLPSFAVYSVPAARDYWKATKASFEPGFLREDFPAMTWKTWDRTKAKGDYPENLDLISFVDEAWEAYIGALGDLVANAAGRLGLERLEPEAKRALFMGAMFSSAAGRRLSGFLQHGVGVAAARKAFLGPSDMAVRWRKEIDALEEAAKHG